MNYHKPDAAGIYWRNETLTLAWSFSYNHMQREQEQTAECSFPQWKQQVNIERNDMPSLQRCVYST